MDKAVHPTQEPIEFLTRRDRFGIIRTAELPRLDALKPHVLFDPHAEIAAHQTDDRIAIRKPHDSRFVGAPWQVSSHGKHVIAGFRREVKEHHYLLRSYSRKLSVGASPP